MINWLKNNKLSLTIGLFIVIISIVPSSGLPRYNIAFADKIVHIAMYFTLTLAFFKYYRYFVFVVVVGNNTVDTHSYLRRCYRV